MRSLLLTLLALSLTSECLAESALPGIPEDIAVRAILGEAEDQGYQGMLQLAYALQNRGSTKGVYGYKAISKRFEGYWRGDRRLDEKVVLEAIKAVKTARMTKKYNLIGNSAHWENVKAFGVPYWAVGHKPYAVIGDHAFYEGIA